MNDEMIQLYKQAEKEALTKSDPSEALFNQIPKLIKAEVALMQENYGVLDWLRAPLIVALFERMAEKIRTDGADFEHFDAFVNLVKGEIALASMTITHNENK